jgi:hypothetical protein
VSLDFFVKINVPSLLFEWIHSKRRHMLGQELVECLVGVDTNLKLEQCLELSEIDSEYEKDSD